MPFLNDFRLKTAINWGPCCERNLTGSRKTEEEEFKDRLKEAAVNL